MRLETWELVVRLGGLCLLAAAWFYSGVAAISGATRTAGRSAGLARRFRAVTVYALGAIPYFAICALLWRPLPVTPSVAARIALLASGALFGLAGAAFYFLGRRELGEMYNVSSSLGSELYESHLLVKTGPYSWCRHPMYLGLALSALGGLMVYRTWTLVFMILSLAGAALKARTEETLLAAEFGKEWEEYASRVPPWLPRAPRAKKEVSHVERTTAG